MPRCVAHVDAIGRYRTVVDDVSGIASLVLSVTGASHGRPVQQADDASARVLFTRFVVSVAMDNASIGRAQATALLYDREPTPIGSDATPA